MSCLRSSLKECYNLEARLYVVSMYNFSYSLLYYDISAPAYSKCDGADIITVFFHHILSLE